MPTKDEENMPIKDEEKICSCSFCGKKNKQVVKLIAGPSGSFICNECVKVCNDIIVQEEVDLVKENKKETSISKRPLPKEIVAHLNEHIIGQEGPKKTLAIAVYNHFKRLDSNEMNLGVKIKKSNVLLIGPSGSGKTLLAETLAEIMDVPFTLADATTITEAGYVGEDVEHVIKKLLEKAGGDVAKAERGIVYLDEIDKISRKSDNPSTTRDVGGEGVQQALLKLIEGTIVSVPAAGSGRKKPGESNNIQVDTSNILFICGGAFAGIEKVIEQKKTKSGIGFGATIVKKSKEENLTSVMAKIEPDDLVSFGLIPEFIGRLPILTMLSELTVDDLINILTEPKNSITKQFQGLFEMENIQLNFTEDSILSVAELALKRKIGARGLRSILEDSLAETMYESPSMTGIESIEINRDVVINGKEAIYTMIEDHKVEQKAA